MLTMIENPYNPLQPTTDPTLFYNRQNALSFFRRHLAGAINETAIVILGQRGIGKSALLSQVPLHIDERYVCVQVDISQLELDDEASLIAPLVDAIRLMMETIEASTYRLPNFPGYQDGEEDAVTDLWRWFSDDYLDVALSAIRRERHLVLLMDEAQVLFQAVSQGNLPTDFFSKLATTIEKHAHLDVIVALDILFEAQALQTPPFHDTERHYRLAHLPLGEAKRLIEEPVASHYQFHQEALERVLVLAGGHPFHVHSICRLLFRLHQERGMTEISLNEVEAIYTAALEQTGEVMSNLWEHARPNERLSLTALLDLHHHNQGKRFPLSTIQDWLGQTDYALSEVQLSAALRGLAYLGLVTVDENGDYYFTSAIQGDWLYRYTNLLPEKQKNRPKLTVRPLREMIGLGVAVVVLLAIVLFAIFGQGDQDNPTEDDTPRLPTSTLPTGQVDRFTPEATQPVPPSLSPFLFGG
jgi:hypothetical protein